MNECGHKEAYENCETHCVGCEYEHALAASQAENLRLRAAIEEHGVHLDGCMYLAIQCDAQIHCDCGLEQALLIHSPTQELKEALKSARNGMKSLQVFIKLFSTVNDPELLTRKRIIHGGGLTKK